MNESRPIDELLTLLLTLDASDRRERLRRIAITDPDLAARLDACLTSSETVTTPISGAVLGRPDQERDLGSDLSGRLIGAYTLVEELGRGGMGVVYRARRTDRSFDREVAIKFLAGSGWPGSRVEAFRREQRILASMDHPNIARLLDAGSSAELGPYVIMELVVGEPIDAYCDRRNLRVRERLTLFQKVCSAVQSSHQLLIVHRDIKPSNVLVNADGEPKLLDFGIAKLLEESGGDPQTATRVMTPRFASPEQIAGGAVTTATDVYALALLLYRILTGRSPYAASDDGSLFEYQKAVLEGAAATVTQAAEEAGRPTDVVRALRGDLENIIVKALERDPGRRYGTASALAHDIRQHLEGRPVSARAPTMGYRLGKFVRRNAVVVGVLGTLFLGLAVAALTTYRQARIAQAARSVTAQRNDDLQKLTETLLFDVHESLQKIPGTTDARAALASSAAEYIGRLRHDAAGDPQLATSLVAAYERVGDLIGNPAADNRGDREGARAKFAEGLAFCDELGVWTVEHAALARGCLRLRRRVGLMAYAAGELDEAHAIVETAIEEGRALRTRHPTDIDIHAEYANALGLLGEIHTWNSRSDDGIRLLRESIDELTGVRESGWNPGEAINSLASAKSTLGVELVYREQFEDGFRQHRDAVDLTRQYYEGDPNSRELRRNYWFQLISWTNSLVDGPGEVDELTRVAETMLAIARAMRAEDPDSDLTRADLATSARYYARAMVKARKPTEAIPAFEEAIALYGNDRETGRGAPPNRGVALAKVGLAEAYQQLGRSKQACVHYAESLDILDALVASGEIDPADAEWPRLVREARADAGCS